MKAWSLWSECVQVMTGTGNAGGTGSVGALRIASIEGAVRVVILVVPHPDRLFACFFLEIFF